jgi:hypothetical protein
VRPTDTDAAEAAIDRVEEALQTRAGAAVTTATLDGFEVTSVDVPQIGSAAYAQEDGVFVFALEAQDVAEALAAHRDGATLAQDERYTTTWALAGEHGGNELFLDIGSIVDAAGSLIPLSGDERDMLLQIGAMSASFPASGDASEIHIVLTRR